MALQTESYKGTRDFYPKDMQFRNWMFGTLSKVARAFGYLEYTGPMLESFDLYAAKSGEEIVNNQLYWLIDKGERKIAVRPELTPTLARMVAAKLNELPKPIRLFSIPNLWRYERPQRGRLREFWQLNVDVLGGDALYADAEVLTLALELMRAFGGEKNMLVKVNHRGLMDEFFAKKLGLTVEQSHKVVKAIDAKDKVDKEKFEGWLIESGVKPEQISELENFFVSSLDEIAAMVPCDGAVHLQKLFGLLKESGAHVNSGASASQTAGLNVVFDPSVMRGLDYYTGTVFEIYDQSPDNRRAIFGGGRYDNLIGMFGKDQLSGVGFGMGDASLELFLQTHKLIPSFKSEIDVMITLPNEEVRALAEQLARDLRQAGLNVITPLAVGSFGSQLKQATKHDAKVAILFGEEELKLGKVLIKNLANGEQNTVSNADVVKSVQGFLV